MRCDSSSLLLLFQQSGEESGWTTQRDRSTVPSPVWNNTSDVAAERQEQAQQGLWRSERAPLSKRRHSCKTALGGIMREAKLSQTMDCLDMGGKAEKSHG